jgi:hypothetical protein
MNALSRSNRFLALCLTVTLAGLGLATPAHAENVELVNGETHRLKGSVGITFWMDRGATHPFATEAKYKVLYPEEEHHLLEGARIEAPEGFVVKQIALTVRTEPASHSYRMGRTEYTRKYEQHLISGAWDVTVPQDCPEGEYTIKIILPMVDPIRESLGAASPEGETSIYLRVQTFRTARNRSSSRVADQFWKGVGCLVALTATLAIVGFSLFALFYAGSFHAILLGGLFGVAAWFSALGFFGCMGQAMQDLYLLDPVKAVGAGLAVNLGYVALFWVCSGFGGWGRTWAISLGIGLLLVIAVAVMVSTMPLKGNADLEAKPFVASALPAMMPGLLVVWLLSLRGASRQPSSEDPTPAQPSDDAVLREVEMAAILEFLRRNGSRPN